MSSKKRAGFAKNVRQAAISRVAYLKWKAWTNLAFQLLLRLYEDTPKQFHTPTKQRVQFSIMISSKFPRSLRTPMWWGDHKPRWKSTFSQLSLNRSPHRIPVPIARTTSGNGSLILNWVGKHANSSR